jgi:hypothetical protein
MKYKSAGFKRKTAMQQFLRSFADYRAQKPNNLVSEVSQFYISGVDRTMSPSLPLPGWFIVRDRDPKAPAFACVELVHAAGHAVWDIHVATAS